MSGEIENVPVEQRKRRPIPIFEDRFVQNERYSHNTPYIDLSKPYLRKNILAEIGNNLNELVEIKTGGKSIDYTIEERKFEKPMIKEKKDEGKKVEDEKIENSMTTKPSEMPKIEDKNDIKIGIGNIIPETPSEKVESKIETKQIENKEKLIENKKKIIKRKVNYMSDEDPNMSPEMRRRIRKDEVEEVLEGKELNDKIRTSAHLAAQTQKEIENLRLKLDENKSGIQKDLNMKFGNLDSKFNEIGTKLKETCEGIECIKKDIKKQELVECPECGNQSVPFKASYCSDCGAKISSWTEDDGVTPLKHWKPTWAK